MNKKYSFPLTILAVIIFNFKCENAENSQTLTNIFKYGDKTNLNSEVNLSSNDLSYTSDLYAFVGMIESDTVFGFRITDLINVKYNWMNVNSGFTVSNIRLDFQDGTYSILKPFQVQKSAITEGESKYNKNEYFFKVEDFKKFDRPLKLLTFLDEKSSISREIYGVSMSKNGVSNDLDFIVRAYMIPLNISSLRVLPELTCYLRQGNIDRNLGFPKVFPNMMNSFCNVISETGCTCK